MLAFWFQTANDMRKQYLGYPTQDYWRSVVNLPRYEKWDLTVFWEQHNEHRVIVPELLYALDDKLFGAHQYLPLVLSTLFQVATFSLLAWVIWTDSNLSAPLRLSAIFIGGLLLGWPGISYVLSFSFLIQWTLAQFLAMAALVAIARGRLALSIVCAFVATFSAGHGMFIWPVLLPAALALRIGWRRSLYLAASGTASILLYFYRWVPSVDSQSHRFLQFPYWFFAFLASMMSMPFSADRRELGLWLGPASFLLFAVILLIAYRRRLLAETPAIVLFGAAIFSLLTILVCAIGRTLPTYWDYPTAKVARYLSVPLCYWAVLLAATIWVAARSRASAAWVAIVITATSLAYQFPRLDPWLQRQFDFYSRSQNASLAMESGLICDNLIERDLYPASQNIHDWDPILRQRRLSIYSGEEFQWVGKPLSSLMTISAPSKGAVTTSIPFACAVQLAGWLDGDQRDLILVNGQGIIAGLGRRLPAGLPLYLPKVWAAATPKENWTAFAGYPLAGQSVQPYVVSADHRSASPLGSPISLTTSVLR